MPAMDFGVEDLLLEVEDSITTNNVMRVRDAAKACGSHDLLSVCDSFIASHCWEIFMEGGAAYGEEESSLLLFKALQEAGNSKAELKADDDLADG